MAHLPESGPHGHWGRDMPLSVGFGALEPYLVRTVLLRSEQFMDSRKRILMRAANEVAPMCRYLNKSEGPLMAALYGTDGHKLAAAYEFDPFEYDQRQVLRNICANAAVADAESCVLVGNKHFVPRQMGLICEQLSHMLEVINVIPLPPIIVMQDRFIDMTNGITYSYTGVRKKEHPVEETWKPQRFR